jgi:hypothetical protein
VSDAPASLLDEAIAAEQETGRYEADRGQALTAIGLRLLRMGAGTALLVVGAALLVLPGPGLVVVALGLGLLSRDVAWAARLLDRVQARMAATPIGSGRRAALVTVVASGLVALAATLLV